MREIVIGVRMSEYERAMLAALVKYEGRGGQGETLRELVRRAAADRGLWPPSEPATAKEKACHE
ncbi:MAG: hypothetical protein ACOYZ7_01160 [Chloroflexota bacterium]